MTSNYPNTLTRTQTPRCTTRFSGCDPHARLRDDPGPNIAMQLDTGGQNNMTGYMQFPGLLRHGLQVCAGPAAASSRITQLVSAAFTFIEMSGIKSRTSHHFTSFTPSHAHRYKDLICVQPVFSIDTLHSMAELMKSVPPSTQTSKSHRRHPGTNRGQMTVGFHVDWTPST